MVAAALLGVSPVTKAETLNFSGDGTVRFLASDWADYLAGSSTFNAGANDGGRIFWRGAAGDGQYIHFDLSRLSGVTLTSGATVTLQNTNATWGGSVDGSYIASANGAWWATTGTAVPGATAITDATNPTGSYGSGTSVSWGIGQTGLQSLVDGAATFNGFAIIGGNGSQMHFNGPLNPYLTITTSSSMSDVVTVTGGAAWSNYAFSQGVLTITGAVAGGNSGGGDVTINRLGTVFVDNSSSYNYYWSVDSTRINAGGMLMLYGHSHLHNLTLAGGEIAGIRPDGTYGTWEFDDATTVTGGVVSTISAQRVKFANGGITIDAGSTLRFSGSVREGNMNPTIGAGAKLVNAAAPGTSFSLGALTLNGGELAATSAPASNLGNYQLRGDVTVGGSAMSTISADVRVRDNEDRVFDVADVTAGVDLLLSGKIGHYNGASGGSFTKAGAGTMRISGTTDVYRGTVNAGTLILGDTAIEGWWGGGLTTNASAEMNATGTRTASYAISGTGGLTKSGNGTLTLSGNNTYSGGTTINAGTLMATRSKLGFGAVVINNGGTLHVNDQWVFCGGNGFGVAERNVASVTLNAGGVLYMDPTNGFANAITNFYLNGGTVTGGANDSGFGSLILFNGNEQITAGGGVTSTIGVSLGINGNNNSITVDAGSRLELTNVLKVGEWTWAGPGGFIKNGGGTLVLSGANSYGGQTDINAGTVLATSSTALGSGGHNGTTMSWIREGATLALQGGIILDEHFHVWGAGVGGLGAVRSLSGENALTNAPNGAPGFCLRSNTVVGVDAGTLTVSGFYEAEGSFGLTKVGNGTLVLTTDNTYTGGTTVNAGTLSVAGNGGWGRLRGTLTVNAGGTVTTTGDGTGFGYFNQLTTLNIIGGLVNGGSNHIWNLTGGVNMTGGEMNASFQWNRTNLTTNASANSAVISGALNLRGDGGYSSWNVDVADGAADADLLVSAAITGNGVALTKSGNGKMRLTGGNTYNGSTIVNGGTLELPPGDWVTGNPWGAGGANGAFTIGAGATLSTSDGTTQFKSGLTLNGGTLSSRGLTYAGAWRNIVLSADVTAGGAAVSTISSAINLDANRTFTVGDGSTLNVTGELASWYGNGGSLTKSGNGVLALASGNSYGGATTINAGTLKIGNGGATGSLYSPSVSGGGNLTFGSNGAIVNNSALVYDIAGGSVHVNRFVSGTGTVSVTGDQSVHFADGTNISTSGAQTYAATATGGRYRGFNLTDNASVALTSSGAISMTGMLGTANGSTGRLTINTSAGDGAVTLNTPVGVSGVDYGLAEITVNAGAGAITLGTFNGQNWGTVGALTLTGGAVNSTANIADLGAITITNSSAGTFSGSLSGSGSLTKAGNGTLTLGALNGYTGGTIVNAGTLNIDVQGDQNSSAVGANRTVSVASGATLRLNKTDGLGYFGANPGSLTIAGTMTIAAGIHASVANYGLTLDGGTLTSEGQGSNNGNYILDGTVTTLANAAASVISADSVQLRNGSGAANQSVAFDVADGAAAADLSVSSVLANGNGANGLTKSGNGLLALSGANTYSGATTVNAGTLALTGNGSVNSSASVTINGATAALAHRGSVALTPTVTLTLGTVSGTGTITALNVANDAANVITPGTAGVGTLTVGTLGFLGQANVNFSSAGAAATNRLSVGTLDLTNAGTILVNVGGVAQGGWSTGTYDLIDYATALGSVGTAFLKGAIAGTTSRTLTDLKTDVAGKISLVITSEIPKWTGADSSEWKAGPTGAIGNWKLSTNAATDYQQGDAVIFDDSASNKTLMLNGGVTPTAVTFNNTGANTYTIEDFSENDPGFITGLTGLTKNGSGELIINNLNDYTGPTVINSGKVTLGSGAQLGYNSPLTLAGGQLDLGGNVQNFGAVTITHAAAVAADDTIGFGTISAPSYVVSNATGEAVIWADLGGNSATFTKSGAGQVTLWGANTFSGATTIAGGVLRIENILSAASAPLNLSGGQLDLGGTTQTVGSLTVTAAYGAGETILDGSVIADSFAASNAAGNAILSADLRSNVNAGFTKTGAGAITLSGANTFTGNFTLHAGQVNVESVTALGSGNLIINGGALGNASGNAVTLTANHAQSWNGDFGFNGPGDLNLGTGAVTVSANRIITVTAGSLSVGGVVGGGAFTLTKSGSGTLNLAAGSSLSGVTTVSGGTLVYGGSYASSTHAIGSGAVLEIAVGPGQRDSASTTFSGAGTLRKSGSGRIVWGSNTATFALGSGSLIDVQGGLFTAGSNANENWSANLSSLNVEADAVFDTVEANVRVNRITGTGTIKTGFPGAGYENLTIGVDDGSSTFAGVIENGVAAGNLVKIGTGTITLSGTTTHTGTTTVADGTLRAGSGTAFTNKGRLALANAAVFDLGGYNAAFTSFESTSANLITNTGAGTYVSGANAVGTPAGAGVYVDAFTLSALDQTINARITDGPSRRIQLVIANNNSAANLANIVNGANSFSGGLVLTHTAGGTRLRLNSPLSGTPLGSGPVIIGQAATDKAQILFDSASPVTLANDIVVNTAVGSDNAGALRVDTAGHVVSGKVTANLAALHIANGGSISLTGQVTGAAGLILERGITVTLANATASANDYAGDTVVNLGAADGRSATLRLGGANQIPTGASAGNVTVSSSGTGVGLLDLNGYDQRINGLSGNGIIDGRSGGSAGTNTLTVGDNDATSTFAGIIRNSVGTLALTKTGNGLLSLEGDNTYDGATTIEAGTLQIVGRLGRGAVTIASGATLEVNRSNDYSTAGGQSFSGAGRLVKNGAGNLTFAYATISDEPLVSGLQNLEINGGVVRTDNWARWKSDLNLTVNGTGVFEMWNTTTSLGTLNGNGTIRNTVNYGDYASGAAYATNNLSVAAGNFAGTITDNGNGNGPNTGTTGDTRINLIKTGSGTLTLSAANTYGGTTTVNGGRLVVTHASALGAGTVTINAGTLQVDAATPLGNAITVNNGGELGGKGSTGSVTVATGGTISPGASPGILNAGNLTLAGGSTINWQVNDATGTAGVSYDQLMVSGMLDLSQANPNSRILLRISSLAGLNTAGDALNFGAPDGVASIRTFQFGQAGGITLNNGQNISDVFAFDVSGFTYSDGSSSNAALWSINWNEDTGAITLTAVPEPSTYGIGLGALALAAAALRRRRRKQTPAS